VYLLWRALPTACLPTGGAAQRYSFGTEPRPYRYRRRRCGYPRQDNPNNLTVHSRYENGITNKRNVLTLSRALRFSFLFNAFFFCCICSIPSFTISLNWESISDGACEGMAPVFMGEGKLMAGPDQLGNWPTYGAAG